MLHIRSGAKMGEQASESDAYGDTLDILKAHAKVSGDVHFFAGSWDIAKQFLGIGFTLSFTGVITFTHDYDEVVRYSPLNMIISLF